MNEDLGAVALPRKKAIQPTAILSFVVLGMVGVDAIGSWLCGLHVTGLVGAVGELGLLGCLGTAYMWLRGTDRLIEMATYVALWLVFSFAAAVLTYLTAAWNLPLQDAMLRACDRTLHFNLRAFSLWLVAHSALLLILRIDYASLLIQIAATVFLLAHFRVAGRNASFLASAIFSLLITTVLAGLLPALGPTVQDNPVIAAPPPYVRDILAMRAGSGVTRNLADLQGIICFPSYHTVLAILITWANRGLKSFWPLAVVNGLMLLSVPSVGNHYLSDMVGGAAVTAASIVITKFALPKKAVPF